MLSALAFFTLAACGSDVMMNSTVVEDVDGTLARETHEVYAPKLDILYVIDGSGSMSNERELLAYNFNKFFDQLESESFEGIDWRVGFTSTDPATPIHHWVDASNPNAAYDLSVALLNDFEGAFFLERGFDSLLESAAHDDDFHRVDADLVAIFTSDEDDNSETTPGGYEQLIAGFKHAPFTTTEMALIYTENDVLGYGVNPECGVNEVYGYKYEVVAETTLSLCDTDSWSNSLDWNRDRLLALSTDYALENVPANQAEIVVEVNYQTVDGWYYDDRSNTVHLDAAPPVGSYVSISYIY